MIRPMVSIVEYCTEEVSRQVHDVHQLDGVERVGWMLNAWAALLRNPQVPIDHNLVNALGRMIEPNKNRDGFRTVEVRVGPNACPPAERVQYLVEELCEARALLPPIEFAIFVNIFEEIYWHFFCCNTNAVIYVRVAKKQIFANTSKLCLTLNSE